MDHILASTLRNAKLVGGLWLGLAAVGCSSPSARVHVGYLQTELAGELGLGPTEIAGVQVDVDPIDIDRSLGVDSASGSPYFRAEADAGPVRLTASAFRYAQDGRGLLTADFGDINAGTAVDSSIEIGNLKAALTVDVLDLDTFRVSPGIGVDVFDVEATVDPVNPLLDPLRERIDEVLPLPMLFLQAEVDLDFVGAVVDIGGLRYGVDGVDGSFVDIEALVYARPVEHLELFAGYRFISLGVDGRIDGQAVDVDLDLHGWFVGGGVAF